MSLKNPDRKQGPIRSPCALAHLEDLEAYVPGQPPGTRALRLASNENPYGCSPGAARAIGQTSLAIYPDGSALALRRALADAHDLHPDRILCGAGSDEILHMLARAYLDPGSRVVVTRHAFLMYELAARQSGATVDVVPETTALSADVDQMLAAVGPETRMVFIANPNNPTGSWLSARDLARLHRDLPERVLLVIDGAYAEYADDPDYGDGLDLARIHANVVAVRTFSKIHGLAAVRLGWAYAAPEVISVLNRVRAPFNVSGPAMAAGLAALADTEFVADSARRNRMLRTRLSNGLAGIGLEVFPSQGNFVLARFDGEQQARGAAAALLEADIKVRETSAYRLPDCLRITVGDAEALKALLAVLGAFLAR